MRRQHGVVTRAQLLAFGVGAAAIKHRVARGRLHRVWPGVYAVGRPELNDRGRWMAAVLTSGPGAALSHTSAGRLWGILVARISTVEVSVPSSRAPKQRSGIRIHRRTDLAAATATCDRIPLTTPSLTLLDLATTLEPRPLQRAVNEADRLDLIDPESLRGALDSSPRRPGLGRLRRLLDARTFRLTDSELEAKFLPLARRAGLPLPKTGARVNGFKVDFFWPDLGLVVETDGLRYHRTPAQQASDRMRDQAHAAAGLTQLRFTHQQVARDPERVLATLAAVARRLGK